MLEEALDFHEKMALILANMLFSIVGFSVVTVNLSLAIYNISSKYT